MEDTRRHSHTPVHTHRPTHTGHVHLHVQPSVHTYVARTRTSLSQPRASACTHTHTHALHAFSCAKPLRTNMQAGTCRCPSREQAPSALASPHTRVEGHACAHTRFPPHPGRRTWAGAHTHTGCAHLRTNASQPGNVQEPKGEKDVSPTGRYVGRWGVGPTAPSVCPSWTDTSSSPHKGTFNSGQRRWGTHSGHRAGGGKRKVASKE